MSERERECEREGERERKEELAQTADAQTIVEEFN